jgi:hypothetical protein
MVDRNIILNLDIVTDLHTCVNKNSLAKIAVLANAGIWPDLALMPDSGPLPNFSCIGYLSSRVYERSQEPPPMLTGF